MKPCRAPRTGSPQRRTAPPETTVPPHQDDPPSPFPHIDIAGVQPRPICGEGHPPGPLLGGGAPLERVSYLQGPRTKHPVPWLKSIARANLNAREASDSGLHLSSSTGIREGITTRPSSNSRASRWTISALLIVPRLPYPGLSPPPRLPYPKVCVQPGTPCPVPLLSAGCPRRHAACTARTRRRASSKGFIMYRPPTGSTSTSRAAPAPTTSRQRTERHEAPAWRSAVPRGAGARYGPHKTPTRHFRAFETCWRTRRSNRMDQ